MSFDICYVVSHGFAARMVLQTGLLERLVKKGKKVALISPDAADENLQNLGKSVGVSLFEYNLNRSWRNEYFELRKYVFEDVRSNPALWEKYVYATKVNPSPRFWRRQLPRTYYGVNRLVRVAPFLRYFFRGYERRMLGSEKTASLLQKIDPKLVVVTYPVNPTESSVLFAAKKLGIPTCMHLLSWDNITCKGHFPALADEYIAWGPIMKRELQEYYDIKDEKIHSCGVPHFDLHYDISNNEGQPSVKYFRTIGLVPGLPTLFFAMSSPRFAPKEIEIVEWVSDQVNKNAWGKEMQLIIRPHPQNVKGGMADNSWMPRLDKLINERVKVDYPNLTESKMPWSMQEEDMIRLSALLSGSLLCLNSGSTMSIDALMLNKPVILTSFDGDAKLDYWKSARRLTDYYHLKKLLSFGGVSIAKSYAELGQLIIQYHQYPEMNLEQRNQTRFEECGPYDGKATERVAEILCKLGS